MLLDVLLVALIDLPFGARPDQLLDGRIDTLLAVRLVVRLCKLCCDGYFYPALVEVDCCVAAEDPVLDLVMDLVLDLVLDLNLLKLALDPANPQLLELLCQRILLLRTSTGHLSSMSPFGRPGYHPTLLLLHLTDYLLSLSLLSSAG